MAKAIRIQKTGGPEVMALEDVALPPPGPGMVTVANRAIGLNFIDTYFRSGLYPMPLPSGLGMEGAGVVEASGEGVDLAVGDRVAYCSAGIGAYAQVLNLPAARLVRIPEGIDFEQAAAPLEVQTGAEEVEALEAVEDFEEVAEVLEEAPADAEPVRKPESPRPVRQPESAPAAGQAVVMNESLKKDLRNVLGVIDELLDALPEKKIREFAKSDHFKVYEKLFSELGLDKPR